MFRLGGGETGRNLLSSVTTGASHDQENDRDDLGN